MPILLGLAVAFTYGCGDFFGGLSAKRSATLAVVVTSQLWSIALLAVLVITPFALGGGEGPRLRDLLLGGVAGVVGPIGIVLLYRGLSTGRMSVVAPVTAIGASVVPVAWGLLNGERPSALALLGAVVAMVAVILISGAPGHTGELGPPALPNRQVLPMAVGAGVAFGLVFVALGSTGDHAGLWPLVVSRPLGVGLVSVAAGMTGRSIRPARVDRWTIAVAGLADITANGLFLAAAHQGLLSIVAVVSSLYPASTVALARVVLDERMHRVQIAGLLLAAGGVMAMATG